MPSGLRPTPGISSCMHQRLESDSALRKSSGLSESVHQWDDSYLMFCLLTQICCRTQSLLDLLGMELSGRKHANRSTTESYFNLNMSVEFNQLHLETGWYTFHCNPKSLDLERSIRETLPWLRWVFQQRSWGDLLFQGLSARKRVCFIAEYESATGTALFYLCVSFWSCVETYSFLSRIGHIFNPQTISGPSAQTCSLGPFLSTQSQNKASSVALSPSCLACLTVLFRVVALRGYRGGTTWPLFHQVAIVQRKRPIRSQI